MNAKELIDILCPEHDRTSCNDENIGNGFSHKFDEFSDDFLTTIDSEDFPRCGRCALLQIERGESTDDNKVLGSITIHFKSL